MTSLNLSNNNLTRGKQNGTDGFGNPTYDTDMTAVKAIADALIVSTSMTFVDLSGNVLEAKGAKALSPALRSTSLTSLNLADTKLGVRSRDNDGCAPWDSDPTGVQALAKELSVSTSMTSLK